jgi:hypothetical protein
MYSLKREAIIEGIYPKRFSIPILARTFFHQVRRHGRLNEVYLMMYYYLFTNPLKALGQISLAIKMLFAGRLSLIEHGIKRKKELRTILEAAERRKEVPVL